MKRLAKLGKALPLGVALGGAACGANADPGGDIKFRQLDLLSDFETGNGLLPGHAWSGTWQLGFDLTPGAKSAPTPSNEVLTPPRKNPDGTTSMHAYHVIEDGTHTLWGTAWLAWLNSQKAIDVSSYTGLTLWARSDSPPIAVKVGISDYGSYPTPADTVALCDMNDNSVGGIGCFDDYSIKIYPDTVWRRYDIPFSSLTTGGWGLNHAFDPRRVYAIKFSVLPQTKYSEWMDDIGFYLR